jgi:hypothetical protein
MLFAYESGLTAAAHREHVLEALLDMEKLKHNLDSANPSLESLLRLFEDPSAALRERLQARLLELRPLGARTRTYLIPEECHPGYSELERVITSLTWLHAEIILATSTE